MGDATAKRIRWIDISRGIAIIAVALFHSALSLRSADINGPWVPVVLLLETFMLPLFFFASGLVSRGVLTQPSSHTWRKRILYFLYLYALWTVLHGVLKSLITGTLDTEVWKSFARMFIRPDDSIWFLYAIAIYTLYVWLLRRLPTWIPFSFAILVSLFFYSGVASEVLGYIPTSWMKTGSLLIFFVAGIFLRTWLLATVERMTALVGVVILIVYMAATFAWWRTPIHDIEVTRGIISACGVVAGVALALLVSRLRGFGWLEYLGQNTLPIYVIHFLVIAILVRLVKEIDFAPISLISLLLPPFVAFVSITVSLAVNVPLRRVPGIFTAPWPTRTKH